MAKSDDLDDLATAAATSTGTTSTAASRLDAARDLLSRASDALKKAKLADKRAGRAGLLSEEVDDIRGRVEILRKHLDEAGATDG
jgi:hypothetical protein